MNRLIYRPSSKGDERDFSTFIRVSSWQNAGKITLLSYVKSHRNGQKAMKEQIYGSDLFCMNLCCDFV